jgi:hypothetical protein
MPGWGIRKLAPALVSGRRGFLLVPLVAALAAEPSVACSVCYGAGESAMTAGMNNGILSMLGLVVVVQMGFVVLFWSFWRRARALRRREQCSLIDGGQGK